MQTVYFALTVPELPSVDQEISFDSSSGVDGTATVIQWGSSGALVQIDFTTPFSSTRYVVAGNNTGGDDMVGWANRMVKRVDGIDILVSPNAQCEFLLQSP